MNAIVPPLVEIDVVSDVVCPWCFVGKRQLDQALARWLERNPGQPAPPVRWRPFQLNPELPAEGIPRAAYMEAKFGSSDGAVHDRVRQAARQVGLELALERIQVQPNTLKAHALIEVAADTDRQTALVEAFFSGYFLEGRNLADDATLRDIAREAGLDNALIDTVLDDDAVTRLVAAADAEIREYGVRGVPLFIFGGADDRRLGVSGAQGADALQRALEQAAGAQPS